MRYLLTGACGFIGSHFLKHLLASEPDSFVSVLDAITYAANYANLPAGSQQWNLRVGRVECAEDVHAAACAAEVEMIIHFAAESHVDRSIADAAPFLKTNVIGTHVLLEEARQHGLKFLHISTDEVFGCRVADEGMQFDPGSPYAASKAAAEHLVNAYFNTYELQTEIVRFCNIYGPNQYPEKLIPLAIRNIASGKPVPVYGDGKQTRQWLHVSDACRALMMIKDKGWMKYGSYNVTSGHSVENISLIKQLFKIMAKGEMEGVPDRAGHDRHYRMQGNRIKVLGWKPEVDFAHGLRETVAWYLENGK